jgi:hypothetical protein
MQPHIPVLVNHVTFGMPVLVNSIAKDFHELLQDRCLTSVALLRKLS